MGIHLEVCRIVGPRDDVTGTGASGGVGREAGWPLGGGGGILEGEGIQTLEGGPPGRGLQAAKRQMSQVLIHRRLCK